MVNINVIRASNTALARSQPLTAVVTGGTSGIGKYTVQALAAAHGTQGKGLRIYIVGRNEKAAQEIIAGCLGDCPSGDFIFVKAENLALVSDVDNVCAEIKSSIEKAEGTPKVDILVMTQAIVSFNGRQGLPPPSAPLCLLLTHIKQRRKKVSTGTCRSSTTHACA